jgi:hypothetical protein
MGIAYHGSDLLFGPIPEYFRAAHQLNGRANCVTPRVSRHHPSLPPILAGVRAQWVGHTSARRGCYADVWVQSLVTETTRVPQLSLSPTCGPSMSGLSSPPRFLVHGVHLA